MMLVINEEETLEFPLGLAGTDSDKYLMSIPHLHAVQLLVAMHVHGERTRMGSHQDALASVVCYGQPPFRLMMVKIKTWPSVPGGQNAPVVGSKQVSRMAEGAKNFRVSCQGFQVATYNCRTLSTEDRLQELEEELEHIKWDVVGLSEVRRKGEDLLELKSGNLFYYRGTENGRIGGIGFIISKRLKNNIVEVSSVSDRVGKLVIKLSKRYNVEIIQVYAPTISHNDEEIEAFYEDIQTAMPRKGKHHLRILLGDFNARIGAKRRNESSIGAFGAGPRDDRGHRLIEFAECEKLFIMNSFFKKKQQKKWTWRSPNGGTSEIDYILSNKKNVISDCAVLNRFNAGSDHRMVRCRVQFKASLERQKLLSASSRRIDIHSLRSKCQDFQLELKNRFEALEEVIEDDINSMSGTFTKIIMESAKNIAGTAKEKPLKKISAITKAMMEKRRKMKYNKENLTSKVEYVELCKTVRKHIKEDVRKFNCDMIKRAIEENKSLKSAKRNLLLGKKRILALKTKDGTLTKNQEQILKVATEFYGQLYKTNHIEEERVSTETLNCDIPEILMEEVIHAVRKMKNGKAAGEDQITVDILKEAGDEAIKALTKVFNKCVQKQDVPEDWKNAMIILLFKKGEKEDIKNYRPISLLAVCYKILMKVLTNRLQKALDSAQPREQAGFRSGFSTVDHIQVIREVIERTIEYEIPLCFAFIDYEKAFDSVARSAVIKALNKLDIDNGYSNLIQNIYKGATAKIRLHKPSEKITIGKGVRQGDTISPKLFTAVLEEVFKNLDWHNKGIKVDGEYLSHLRFADDIVILAHSLDELQKMIGELDAESKLVGLKMNLSKTKIMSNPFVDIKKVKLGNKELEHVKNYTYLGQVITMDGNITEEINNRVKLAWRAFGRNINIFKGRLPICLKTKVFNQCILPVLTYASETWTLNKRTLQKLQTTQRSMERCMLGYTRRDRKRNSWIRKQTKVTDVIVRIKSLKWQWAGHLARRRDDRWTSKILFWIPRNKVRPRKRPHVRWIDEIRKFIGPHWRRVTEDRKKWKSLKEAFILQWIETG